MKRSLFLHFSLFSSLIIPCFAAQEVKELENAQKSLKLSVYNFLRCLKKDQSCDKQQRTIVNASLTILGVIGVIATGGTIAYLAKRGNILPQELAQAAIEGDIKQLQILLPIDATASDLNKVTNNGDTLLHLAARNGHHQVVQFLLEHGADVISNNAGQTPLSEAMKFQKIFSHKKNEFSHTIDILTKYASPGLQAPPTPQK